MRVRARRDSFKVFTNYPDSYGTVVVTLLDWGARSRLENCRDDGGGSQHERNTKSTLNMMMIKE